MDTLAIQRRLMDAGFPEKQATKADLENLGAKLTVRFSIMLAAGLTLLFLALEYAPG